MQEISSSLRNLEQSERGFRRKAANVLLRIMSQGTDVVEIGIPRPPEWLSGNSVEGWTTCMKTLPNAG